MGKGDHIRIDNLPEDVDSLTADQFRQIISGRMTSFQVATIKETPEVAPTTDPVIEKQPTVESIPKKERKTPVRKPDDSLDPNEGRGDHHEKQFTIHFERVKSFFIPIETPSKKRGYKIVVFGKKNMTKDIFDNQMLNKFVSKKFKLIKGEGIVNYERNTAKAYADQADEFRQVTAGMPKPLFLEFFFIRNTKRKKFDFSNIHAIVTDQMVTHGWILDDSIEEMLPLPPLTGKTWKGNWKCPGVRITVMRLVQI